MRSARSQRLASTLRRAPPRKTLPTHVRAEGVAGRYVFSSRRLTTTKPVVVGASTSHGAGGKLLWGENRDWSRETLAFLSQHDLHIRHAPAALSRGPLELGPEQDVDDARRVRDHHINGHGELVLGRVVAWMGTGGGMGDLWPAPERRRSLAAASPLGNRGQPWASGWRGRQNGAASWAAVRFSRAAVPQRLTPPLVSCTAYDSAYRSKGVAKTAFRSGALRRGPGGSLQGLRGRCSAIAPSGPP